MNKRKRLARLLKLAQITVAARYHEAQLRKLSSWRCIQSADKTAFELGHRDSKMLFAHYRELVTKEAAQSYWDIRP